MNCKSCQSALPDLLLEPAVATNAAARAHIAACAACAKEFASLESTFALLDDWHAPEVSPYFDQKLAVRLREEQAAPPAGWFERARSYLLLNTGRQFRPALAGALALTLVVGGGSVGIANYPHPQEPSAAVTDLQIFDRNEQSLRQLDQILQEDTIDAPASTAPPQS